MKYILILSILFTSCYTKRKAIEKFCSTDSVSVIVHDTIRTETITKDTIFSAFLDTVLITKDKLSIRYIKYRDSVYINGTCEGDTIYLTRTIKAPCNIPSISSYSFGDWLEGQPFIIGLLFMFCFVCTLLYLFEFAVNIFNRFQSR